MKESNHTIFEIILRYCKNWRIQKERKSLLEEFCVLHMALAEESLLVVDSYIQPCM